MIAYYFDINDCAVDAASETTVMNVIHFMKSASECVDDGMKNPTWLFFAAGILQAQFIAYIHNAYDTATSLMQSESADIYVFTDEELNNCTGQPNVSTSALHRTCKLALCAILQYYAYNTMDTSLKYYGYATSHNLFTNQA